MWDSCHDGSQTLSIGFTTSFLWRKVPESDARSVDGSVYEGVWYCGHRGSVCKGCGTHVMRGNCV